jgi:chemotaxis protein MotA
MKNANRFDWTVCLGVIIGLSAIVSAAWLENLNLAFLWHPTAALIVCGGTFGAVMVRRGAGGLFASLVAIWSLRLKDETSEIHKIEIARLAWLSRSVQKNGVKAFESYADNCSDSLVAQGLILLADGAEKQQIIQILSRQIDSEDERGLQDSATLEAAGALAPTFGILGAVLGLIGVLRVLDKPEMLGVGIATAFVATIYGIGLANLLFFPLAARLRSRHETSMKRREEMIAVILSLSSKETPRAIINQYNLG